MKRIFQVFLICLLVMTFASNCFAAVGTGDVASPNYVGAQEHITSFSISDSGTATMKGALTPKNSTVIDKVDVSFVVKDRSGKVVYNKTHAATWNALYGQYKVEKSFSLSQKGGYTLQASYTSYKNDKLVEVILSNQITKSY